MAESKKKKKTKAVYDDATYRVQLGLVALQKRTAERGDKILVVIEGRDAAGKDGTIRRITENLPAREVRAISLPAPNDRERKSWYFQRFVAQFPASGEIVLFNRSWYNRAGVEPVMGFCTEEEHRVFLQTVPAFEALLVDHGVQIIKYYLDISKKEQKKRLQDRAEDPLKQWKIGPLDGKALKMFDAYSESRDEMLIRTHTQVAPWTIVRADDKPAARLNLMRDLLTRTSPDGEDAGVPPGDPEVVFRFGPEAIKDGRLSR
ncbi:polyphosphate kinase 2 [soil metagenome]